MLVSQIFSIFASKTKMAYYQKYTPVLNDNMIGVIELH